VDSPGKSTVAKRLQNILDKCVVVPMDGYHYTKSELNNFENPQLAFDRRGCEWTFNGPKFVQDVSLLKQNKFGMFPSFDHSIGDPIENDIKVSNDDKFILIEGNYLLLDKEPWVDLKNLFDLTIYVDAGHEMLRQRVIQRHISVGYTLDVAITRFETNDLVNAIEIEKCKDRADLIISSL
jgi:pantothenate kinase